MSFLFILNKLINTSFSLYFIQNFEEHKRKKRVKRKTGVDQFIEDEKK
jgi:hypothetical protein